jgi:hypothetical protein
VDKFVDSFSMAAKALTYKWFIAGISLQPQLFAEKPRLELRAQGYGRSSSPERARARILFQVVRHGDIHIEEDLHVFPSTSVFH